MGYRSNVTAIFYFVQYPPADETGKGFADKAKALLDLWYADLKETTLFKEQWGPGCFSAVERGYVFECESVKWYDSYKDIIDYNVMVEKFCNDFVDNEQLDGGSGLHRMFCYEFVRIGEEMEDIQQESRGDVDYRLGVERSVYVR
jgi:hypothetical protein